MVVLSPRRRILSFPSSPPEAATGRTRMATMIRSENDERLDFAVNIRDVLVVILIEERDWTDPKPDRSFAGRAHRAPRIHSRLPRKARRKTSQASCRSSAADVRSVAGAGYRGEPVAQGAFSG